MAVTLGKRKRGVHLGVCSPAQSPSRNDSGEDDGDEKARVLFQRAFEAKFKPLRVEKIAHEPQEVDSKDTDDDDSVHDSDWSGFSSEVEVVEHAQATLENSVDQIFAGRKKSYMSARPPVLAEASKTRQTAKTSTTSTTEEDGAETANLKNDLALQRLLKESHLLDPTSFGRTSTAPEGKGRLKALDMRLQDLGAKASILQQEKMPLSHRQGIAAKSASREATRRKEAAENGIILERQKFAAKTHRKRDRGIGNPGVGKLKGSTLQLSRRDVASIQGAQGARKGRRR